jgi:membrane protein YqaA with SNARE-associated domain/nitrate reductase NapE component
MGGPGLIAIAFIDSSFLTLPEVADLLVVVFTIREPERWLYFVTMTTIGSVAGCYALYALARVGGRALVQRGFHERHIDWALDWYRRHGALVLILPAVLPPPMPFKAFVLMAGVAGIRPVPFLVAIAVGRFLRYGGEAWLARRYGAEAVHFIQRDALGLLWPVLAVCLLVAAVWWVWRWRRPAAGPPAPPDAPGGADVE